MKKLISWNVNGLRACIQKGFLEYFSETDADLFALQEIKMKPEQLEHSFEGYHTYINSAERKGYSGTAVFSKEEPISVHYGLTDGTHNDEGRAITLEFDNFFFVTVYTPNAKEGLARIDYRTTFEDELRYYLLQLSKKKHVILCGDLNVAHNEIDLKNPKTNRGNPGFSDEERGKFNELLQSGFTDSFRYLYPDKEFAYSWWSYRFNARANNTGWRIDYFVVSDNACEKIIDSKIHSEVFGSDHCPVELLIHL